MDFKAAKDVSLAAGDVGSCVGAETTRLRGTFGALDDDAGDTTTFGVDGRSSDLWLLEICAENEPF